MGALLRDTLRRPNAAIDADQIKERAPLLFRVAEDRKGAKDASNFNNLVTSSPEVLDVSRVRDDSRQAKQTTFDFDGEN